jgi:hypothetical protein
VLVRHASQAEVVADMSLKMATLQRCPLFSEFDAPQLRRASLFFTLRRYPARTGTRYALWCLSARCLFVTWRAPLSHCLLLFFHYQHIQ